MYAKWAYYFFLMLKRQMHTKTSDHTTAKTNSIDQLHITVFSWILMCNAVAPLQKTSCLWCNWRQC